MSKIDFLVIGSAPFEEDCVQVGDFNHDDLSRAECYCFIEAIRRKLGREPDGAWLAVKSFPHDFGTYHEVICRYVEDEEAAVNYAFRCESESPAKWAEVGMKRETVLKMVA